MHPFDNQNVSRGKCMQSACTSTAMRMAGLLVLTAGVLLRIFLFWERGDYLETFKKKSVLLTTVTGLQNR